MDIFTQCQKVNGLINENNESMARDELIQLLDYCNVNRIKYTPLINNLLRQLGLYPYILPDASLWGDQFIYEAFKVNVGDRYLTLHREQSAILNKLLLGKNIAISAPTSFGKSFIIDAFIAIKNPQNILIIVPTIALTDETRRRLQNKFSDSYKIITTADVELAKKNIFIFPQERAMHYVDKLQSLDILVIDEFYKASIKFDKERSPALLRAILRLNKIAKQKYFLAPNISSLKKSMFTRDMDFSSIDFNTVYLEKHFLYDEIRNDESKKSDALISILKSATGKSLIYAGTYTNIETISTLLLDTCEIIKDSPLLQGFSNWLSLNYAKNWNLTSLVKRGFGIHNGRLHRSLSQIQIKLFEEDCGLKNIISTSSIIEGVNTSAENVILWSNKIGSAKIKDFTYRNIIGRGGRMFKYFIGKIYILAEPPKTEDTQLTLEIPDEILDEINSEDYKSELTTDQIEKAQLYKNEMINLLGKDNYTALLAEKALLLNDAYLIKDIVVEVKNNKDFWKGLGFLNSDNVTQWEGLLYRILKLQGGAWDTSYTQFVGFIKVLSNNWHTNLPTLLNSLEPLDIGIDMFFTLERNVAFKLSALVNDINILQKYIFGNTDINISPFVTKLSYAFLPPIVYQLEEYGLPRMVSKKIHDFGFINFNDHNLKLHDVITTFNTNNFNDLENRIDTFDSFDKYIVKYFYDGIALPIKIK
jgi:hypothetical protein